MYGIRGMGKRASGIMRLLGLPLFCILIAVSWVKAEGGESQELNYEPGDIILNVIAFSGSRASLFPKGQDHHLTKLRNTEFPIQFSRGLIGDASAVLPFQGLPRQLEFRDIWTVNLGGLGTSKSKWWRHKNELTDLDYRIRRTEQEEAHSQLELKGDCRGVWKGSLQVELPIESSVLFEATARGDKSFFFVLTPLQTIPFDLGAAEPKQPDEYKLRNKSYTPPVYPQEVLKIGGEGTVELRYYILADGKPDLTRLIFISCPHPALAKSAASAVRQWRFVEKESGKPPGMETTALATVNFQIRR